MPSFKQSKRFILLHHFLCYYLCGVSTKVDSFILINTLVHSRKFYFSLLFARAVLFRGLFLSLAHSGKTLCYFLSSNSGSRMLLVRLLRLMTLLFWQSVSYQSDTYLSMDEMYESYVKSELLILYLKYYFL